MLGVMAMFASLRVSMRGAGAAVRRRRLTRLRAIWKRIALLRGGSFRRTLAQRVEVRRDIGELTALQHRPRHALLLGGALHQWSVIPHSGNEAPRGADDIRGREI